MSSARLNSKASSADVRQCAAEIIDVIPVVMNAVRTSMRNNISEGLSIPQFRCLGYISRQPGSSVSDVAGFLGVTLATASAMIDRLVRAGYVLLETSLEDRRRVALNASAQGKALVDRIRSAARRDMAETLAVAEESQIEALMDGLAALKKLFRRE